MKHKTAPTPSHEAGSTGRAAEFFLGGLLLANGFEVFQPVVDVAVDFLAYNNKRNLLKIQSKCRVNGSVFNFFIPRSSKVDLPTHIFLMQGRVPPNHFWLVPFKELKRLMGPAHTYAVTRGRSVLRLTLSENARRALRGFEGQYGIDEATTWEP